MRFPALPSVGVVTVNRSPKNWARAVYPLIGLHNPGITWRSGMSLVARTPSSGSPSPSFSGSEPPNLLRKRAPEPMGQCEPAHAAAQAQDPAHDGSPRHPPDLPFV